MVVPGNRLMNSELLRSKVLALAGVTGRSSMSPAMVFEAGETCITALGATPTGPRIDTFAACKAR